MDVRILVTAIDNASRTFQQISRNASSSFDGMQQAGMRMQSQGAQLALAGGAISAPIIGLGGVVVREAMAMESAMADVNKVMGEENVKSANLGKTLMELSRKIPVSAKGLAQIAFQAGALGIATKDVGTFTEAVAKMSTAFDIGPAEAGESFAKIKNLFGLTDIKDVVMVGDAINELSNFQGVKAADLVNTLGRIGGVAKNFKLTTEQAAALATAFNKVSPNAEIAATAISGILPQLQVASGQTKKFKTGLGMIGLGAEELQQAIGKDAIGGFNLFIKKLGEADETSRTLALQKMFGQGADARTLASLANNPKILANALQQVTDKSKIAGSMEREFAIRSKTTANSLQLLKNNVTEVAINIGSVLLPALNSAVNVIRPVVMALASFAQANPALFKVIAAVLGVVAVLGVLATAVGTILLFTGSVISSVGIIGTAIGGAMTLFSGLGAAIAGIASAASIAVTAVGGIGVVLAALGAIFAPVAAIAALAVGAFLIIKNWKQVSSFFSSLFSSFAAMARVAWSATVKVLSQAASMTMGFLSSLMGSIGRALTPIVTIITAPFRFVLGVITGIFKGLASVLAAPLAAAFNSVKGTATPVVASIQQQFSQIVAGISSRVGAFLAPVVARFRQMGGEIANLFSQTGAAISSKLAVVGTAFNAFGGWVQSQVAKVSQAFTFMFAPLLKLPQAFSIMGAALNEIFGLSIAKITGFVSSVAASFSQARASGESFGFAIGQALGRVILAVGGVLLKIGQIPQAFMGIGSRIVAAIASVATQLFTSGANLINQLIAGIQSRVGAITGAIGGVAQQVRNFLPFSPARTGPLSDLNRVDLIGTVAQNVSANPLVGAIASVAAQTRNALGMMGVPGMTPTTGTATPTATGANTGLGMTPTSAVGGGAGTLVYSPTINIGKATPESEASFREQLRQHKDEVFQLFDQRQANQRRVAY